MDQILLDKQPGLATSAIVGTLTLAKTGTTARTATFPDAAITVAGLEVANSFTASQTISGGDLSVTRSTNGAVFSLVENTSTGTSANATLRVQNSNGSACRGSWTVFGSASTSSIFGITMANYATALASGASSNGLVIGCQSIDKPIIFGINASEVARFSSSAFTSLVAGIFPNGTAAAPGLRLTTEPSGLYRVGSTAIGVSVDGVAAIRYYKPLAGSYGGIVFCENPADDQPGVVCNTVNSSYMILGSSGVGLSAGGQIRPYGSAHATKANYVEILGAGAVRGYFDGSGIYFVNNTTDATTTSDGSVRLSGGLSVAKNIVTGQSALFTAATAAGTTAGQLQRETNQDKFYGYANGIGGWMDKCLFSQYATVTQAGIVTDQSLASATARGTRTLPANFFKAGKVLKFRLCGRYTTDAAAGNATIQIKLGTTVFRTSGSFALDNSVTALPWELEGEIICQTTGATGTVEGVSVWRHMLTGATGNYDAENLGGTAAVTIDTTASQAFDVIWTATDAGTTITCTCFRLWEVC